MEKYFKDRGFRGKQAYQLNRITFLRISERVKTPAEIEDELEDEYTDTKIKRAHLLGQTNLFD